MATAEQRKALLAVACPWCGAGPGDVCTVPRRNELDTEGGKRRTQGLRVTTLDGGCHDDRWRRALGTTAPVIAAAVAARTHAPQTAQQELLGAGGRERPW